MGSRQGIIAERWPLLRGAARSVAVATLPERLLETLRARRRAGAFRRAGLVFVHVPRSAGTSITDAIFGGFLGHFSIEQVIHTNPRDVLALPRMAIVRNPWDRTVSAFEFARAGGGANWSNKRVQIANPERYRGPTFSAFDRFVRDFLAAQDVTLLDGVFRPQLYYVAASDGTIPFQHVGRFERLGQTEEWLSATLGRRIRFPALNVSARADYRDYYSPDLRNLVGDIYARDAAAFGYDF